MRGGFILLSPELDFYIFLAGGLGAFIRLLVDNGSISLPKKIDGGYALGFISSVLIGGFVGCVVDGSLLTAAMGGYIGSSVLQSIIPSYGKKSEIEI